MAGTVPEVTTASITGISGKTDRPVFFVKLRGSATPTIVIKGDAVTPHSEASIQWGSKMMKNVQNTLVNVKLMKPHEIDEFKEAVRATFKEDTHQYAFAIDAQYCWVKMPFVPGLSDGDFLDEKTAKLDKNSLARVISKFLDDAVWKELGIVVAVDVFNGNNDRFIVSGPGAGGWQNLGNVMFLDPNSNHTTPVIGLDMFDPNSTEADLLTVGGFQGLKVLVDPGKRDEFALACAMGVGKKIKAKMQMAGLTKLTVKIPQRNGYSLLVLNTQDNVEGLFKQYAPVFAQGLADGALRLRLYLQQKVQQYMPGRPRGGGPPRPQTPAPNLPPPRPQNPAPVPQGQPSKTIPKGVLDRMDYLGW
jgi:hypothetical protein